MKVRVKITRDVKKYFDQYGNLTYCINRLFDEFMEDWVGLPIAAITINDEDCCTTTVDITSDYYLAHRESRGPLSKATSPSRLLTYAYNIDYCHNWSKKQELNNLLYKLQQLSKEDLCEFMRIIKEKYL